MNQKITDRIIVIQIYNRHKCVVYTSVLFLFFTIILFLNDSINIIFVDIFIITGSKCSLLANRIFLLFINRIITKILIFIEAS